MPITIACPSCATRYSLPDAVAGKTAKCKKCDQVFRVPAPASDTFKRPEPTLAPLDDDDLPPAAPPRSSTASRPVPEPQRKPEPRLIADDDDDLPPAAPPRSSTASRPVLKPQAEPALPPVRAAGADDLPPPAPSKKPAKELDEFAAHEILDDLPVDDADLPPPPAWSLEKNRAGSRSSKSNQGVLAKLQNAPLPLMIFLGGSAALWLFLLTVVVPSMSGQDVAASPANQSTANATAPVPASGPAPGVISTPNIGAQPVSAPTNPVGIAQAFPPMQGGFPPGFAPPGNPGAGGLPPAPAGLYAAGTNPPNLPKPTLRQDLINQHVQILRGGLTTINDLTSILRTITDVNSYQQAGPRVQQVVQANANFPQQLAALPSLSPAEDREAARQLVNEALATSQTFKVEVERIQRIPGLGPNAAQMSIGLAKMTAGFNQMAAIAKQPEPGPQPYVEVVMKDVKDGDTSNAILENAMKAMDGPGGQMSTWNSVSGSNFRIWPVANPAAFAAQAFPSPARVEIKGHQITVTGHQPDPAQVAAIKAKRAEEEKARAIANAPDPSVPPGTPPIDAALIKIKSGKNHLIQQAAQELARVVPVDARKAEVAKALIPLVSSSDNGSAKEAVTALGNWKTPEAETAIQHILTATTDGGVRDAAIKSLLAFDSPESLKVLAEFMLETTDGFKSKEVLTALIKKGTPSVVPYLIQYLEKSQDGFGRADAMKALGKMKAVNAAPAIAARIKDNLFEAPDALRALGPEAEPAVIPLLKNSDSQIRKLACEVLRDIGGQDTLDTMKKLPADPDVFVKQEAVNAIQAINARLKSKK